ncbi:hypothetical protein [Sphingosinithalassobacter portus]|uniref:hypothetical protein n=1 Tax=Stakelama portus TaxID=2676234 RepID=UPI000D6E905B|nr:hypothetical protein [Sphingosinithalassobacter portus]
MQTMANTYNGWIDWILNTSQLSDKFWHVQAGLAILVIARLLLRVPLRSFLPLFVVIAAEAGNEVLDRIYLGAWNWDDTASDVFYTLLWPTILTCGAFATARYPELSEPPKWLRRWVIRDEKRTDEQE